jgi:hypothetical protein
LACLLCAISGHSRIDLCKQKGRLRSGLSEIPGAIQTPQLLVCLCATFEHANASLEAVLPGFGGLYLCLIRQPSPDIPQRLAPRGTLEDEGPHEDQKHNCRRAEQD